MNYQRIHDEIISSAKNRGWTKKASKGEYVEMHHILPRSMGGDDSPENLIPLTGREHFLIHWLLYKIHKNRQMALAFNKMTVGNKGRRYNSRSFEYARKAHSETQTGKGNHMYGKTHTEEARRKIAESQSGDRHWLYGSSHTDETKDKISKSLKGRKVPPEITDKVQATFRATKPARWNGWWEVDGIRYLTAKEAAEANGFKSMNSIRTKAYSYKYPNYKFIPAKR